ncbi:MAG: hypothetical protein LBQ71_02325 [Hungatella sp.]|jgi:hypothetical protein|nr:hypothetical protein [Hungatella sp.]
MNITAEKVKEAGRCYVQLLGMNNQYQACLKGIKRYKRAAYKIGQILARWFPSVFVISGVVFVIALCRIIYLYPIEPPDPKYVLLNELLKPVGISLISMSVFCFPIALFWGGKSAKKDLTKAIGLRDEIKKRMDNLVQEKKEIISIIPEQYRYPLAAKYFVEVLENGRADSLKEAMNLYEEQLHRWKMESKMDRMLKNQQTESTALWTYILTDSFFR